MDYSGGIIITDWFANESIKNNSLKITIKFLSNEIRADGLDVIIYEKNCTPSKDCNINKIKGCEVEVKATFKDTVKTTLQVQVAEGLSQPLQTLGDNKIKTASFKIKSKFNNQLQSANLNSRQSCNQSSNLSSDLSSNLSSDLSSDLRLISHGEAIPLILMRLNLLKSSVN